MRSIRTIGAVLALLFLIAGTALATRSSLDAHRAPLAASHEPSDSDGAEESSEARESPETAESPGEKSDQSTDAKEAPDTAESNEGDENGAQLTDQHASALVLRLKQAGITATADELKKLAAKYGVGGAVRLEAWAHASGKTVAQLSALVDAGTGWGAIARQLEQANGSLHLSPGIGWIMGHGHGHGGGNEHAEKQEKGSGGNSS